MKAARKPASRPARSSDPVSLRFPTKLYARIRRYAVTHDIPVPVAIRLLTSAQLDALDLRGQLTLADEWQRVQAWRTAQSVADGTARTVTWDELMDGHATALERARGRR